MKTPKTKCWHRYKQCVQWCCTHDPGWGYTSHSCLQALIPSSFVTVWSLSHKALLKSKESWSTQKHHNFYPADWLSL